MIGDAAEAGRLADKLLDLGIYVIGFSYPVVPHGKARIRVQLSAAHSTEDVERAIAAFTEARAALAGSRLAGSQSSVEAGSLLPRTCSSRAATASRSWVIVSCRPASSRAWI